MVKPSWKWGSVDNAEIDSFFIMIANPHQQEAAFHFLTDNEIDVCLRMLTGWKQYGGRLAWRQFSLQSLVHLAVGEAGFRRNPHNMVVLERLLEGYGGYGARNVQNREGQTPRDIAPDIWDQALRNVYQRRKDERWAKGLRWLALGYQDLGSTLQSLPRGVLLHVATFLGPKKKLD